MDNSKELVLWVGGFAGVLLLYSAYKNKHVLDILNTSAKTPSSATTKVSSTPADNSASPGISAVANGIAQSSAYSIGSTDGLYYVSDANGTMISELPATYQSTPQTYIPPRGLLQ